MDNFKGPGLVRMIMLTVIVHVLVMTLTSIPFLKKSIMGTDTSKMTREEKIAQAVTDATSALRKIAAEHGVNPQDISDQFTSAGSRTEKQAVLETAVKKEPAGDTAKKEPAPDKPQSAVEKELEKAAEGPKMPAVGGNDDIF